MFEKITDDNIKKVVNGAIVTTTKEESEKVTLDEKDLDSLRRYKVTHLFGASKEIEYLSTYVELTPEDIELVDIGIIHNTQATRFDANSSAPIQKSAQSLIDEKRWFIQY